MQQSQTSVQRGTDAAFVVTVSAKNGSAAGVSVALAATPSSQKPTFTSGCTAGNNKASCAVGAVSDTKAITLDAQIPVASTATSVSSVTLTATASITTAKMTPPAAQETVSVTGASASPGNSSGSADTPVGTGTTVPLGSLPDLNGASSSLIGAGNAAGLFPSITPSGTTSPSPSPGVRAAETKRNAESAAYSSTLGPVLTAQVAGLIVLALGLMLTLTRLSLRKRPRTPKQGG